MALDPFLGSISPASRPWGIRGRSVSGATVLVQRDKKSRASGVGLADEVRGGCGARGN
ncbi:hypothetical protein ERO13_A05G241500v2 [Gossypium hirsutum]|uniref:Uncharacterized protein n=2 Tax=Gossypium TaxID=3633 RepID=A0A5D2QJ49_GOSTO|nr:hypothetical protein ERO13_A05G241500v2 [Gossypium hirsutum]TYH18280.1 hypothetical protein ES288_A05G257400v1 [Gossypium darwinii]TYI28701.1 hypothetical protein ES332_A05G262400v1 [Gossypium tomentosum]